jgi:hypothetical protein
MPITPSYPGIFAADRDARAITALPTSITAFVGRAARGPLDEPVAVSDFRDFARSFGACDDDGFLGPSLKAFFANGGSQAIVVRVARHARAARLERGAVKLYAASEGGWGNQLRIRIRRGLGDAFDLWVRDGVTGAVETHTDLTLRDTPRRIDRVVNADSQLVRWTAEAPRADAPIPEHSAASAAGRPLWLDDATSTKVERAERGCCGDELTSADFIGAGRHANHEGLYALERAELFNLLVIPPYREGREVEAVIWRAAASYCRARRAFLLVDPMRCCGDPERAKSFLAGLGPRTPDAAVLLPRSGLEGVALGGAVAGCFARTDAQRGVWRAPVGLGATLESVARCAASAPAPRRREPPAPDWLAVAGFDTGGDDSLTDESRAISIRRTALFLEESLRRGLSPWVTFAPNDELLWAQIGARSSAFLDGLFRLGAFAGRTPRDAYFVRCDAQTTAPADIEKGVVNVVVGFAPLCPGEFVLFRLRQSAGKAPA